MSEERVRALALDVAEDQQLAVGCKAGRMAEPKGRRRHHPSPETELDR